MNTNKWIVISQWIDVNERLPTAEDVKADNGIVLCSFLISGKRYTDTAVFERGKFLEYDSLCDDPYKKGQVTHWMPLPKPFNPVVSCETL